MEWPWGRLHTVCRSRQLLEYAHHLNNFMIFKYLYYWYVAPSRDISKCTTKEKHPHMVVSCNSNLDLQDLRYIVFHCKFPWIWSCMWNPLRSRILPNQIHFFSFFFSIYSKKKREYILENKNKKKGCMIIRSENFLLNFVDAILDFIGAICPLPLQPYLC